jgi:transposase
MQMGPKRTLTHGAAASHFGVSVSFVVNLVAAFRSCGSYASSPEGGWRYLKLDPHRAFLERRVVKKAGGTMTELAGEFAAMGVQIDQVSLSPWYRRNGYRYKKAFWPENKIARTWQRRGMSG